ncbi:formyltransferase family protein [Chloroflexota bacterium]
MRVIYMGRKPAASEGLKYLVEKGVDVAVVTAPLANQLVYWKEKLTDTAHQYGIPTATDSELYYYLSKEGKASEKRYMVEDIDLVISFLFWKRIKKPLIELPKIGCINFHPAPLPEFRGVGGYNFAIYENLPYWGISAHFVDESFDTGHIIKVIKFDINPAEETAFSLEQKSQRFLVQLFKEVIDIACERKVLPRSPQGEGRYITREDFEQLRRIYPDDTVEGIERKIRAFWYPPHRGASVEIQGKEFTLANENVLKDIGNKYHR